MEKRQGNQETEHITEGNQQRTGKPRICRGSEKTRSQPKQAKNMQSK